MKKKVGIIVLVLIILIIIAVVVIGILNKEKTQKEGEQSRWQTKEIYVNSLTEVESDLATVPKWEDLTICQQFSTVEYNGQNYDCKYGEVPTDMIGESLGDATLSGYDVYSENTYTKNASLYSIKTISQECAIALQFEGTTEYYAYINAYYRPETLGDFIDDLNLKETVSFGSIWYDDTYTDEEGKYHFDNIEFPDVDDEAIWTMLFSNTSVENIHTDNLNYTTIMSISVDIPILGYKNISCSVTEEGYLVTNILDTGKTFNIGKEKVQEFVDYILNNYEGYKIVYVDSEGNRSDEEFEENDNVSTADDVIVQTENNVVEDVIVTVENGVEEEVTVPQENGVGNNVVEQSIGIN